MSIDFLKSVYYEFLSYFVPQKVNYKVVGQCLKCGKCCREIRSNGLKNEKEIKFMQILFPWYKRFYILRTDENENLVLSCKFLGSDGKCQTYKTRPFVCRNYPKKTINFNAEMIDGCGYKVIKKDFKDYL